MSRNLRTALIFGGFISLIGAAFYPIYFRPLMRLEEYKETWILAVAGYLALCWLWTAPNQTT
ncbi:small integral membrane protein 20 isoform X2 [Pongo abelii]